MKTRLLLVFPIVLTMSNFSDVYGQEVAPNSSKGISPTRAAINAETPDAAWDRQLKAELWQIWQKQYASVEHPWDPQKSLLTELSYEIDTRESSISNIRILRTSSEPIFDSIALDTVKRLAGRPITKLPLAPDEGKTTKTVIFSVNKTKGPPLILKDPTEFKRGIRND